ncbi:MAG: MazG-like family protein [Candidatus Omnitrophica bacterium]|nr:MazG-like family protein [Candidatus Omnitrophota bacterium]
MDLKHFSKINRDRCEHPKGFNHSLTSWSSSDWITAIMGELGEAANIVKKLNRVRDGIRGNKESQDELRKKLRNELADVFIYLDLYFQYLGDNMGEVVQRVFDAKSEQIGYPIKICS